MFFVHFLQGSHFAGCGDFAGFLGNFFRASGITSRFFIGEEPVRQASRKTARYAGTRRLLTGGRTQGRLFEIGLAFLGLDVVYGHDGKRNGTGTILCE